MRRTRRVAALAATALVLSPLPALALGAADDAPQAQVATSYPAVPVEQRLQPWLAGQLDAPGTGVLRVAVNGTSTAAALRAAEAAGLAVQQTWDSVATVVALGTADQVRAVVPLEGVTHVEGDAPLQPLLQTAHRATRSDEALPVFRDGAGRRVDGTGITIAVIDSGIDGTHPMFQRGGRSTVVRNLLNRCALVRVAASSDSCFVQSPVNDTDTSSLGGHGTHVAGIAGGVEVRTTAGKQLRGAAPGANLVGFGLGAGLFVLDAGSAMNWVLEHQSHPCRPANAQTGPVDPACPPIRVTNHSYGPSASANGNTFNPNSAEVKLQQALVGKGVVPVWAAGNDGRNGDRAVTNPPGMDPTPGVLMVASYDDAGTGTRDGRLSSFSSRGKAGDPTTYPDLSAPGDRITSACRPYLSICATGLAPENGPAATDVGTFNTISGTSMAAPYVAGVVAQLFQADPSLSPGEVEDVLEDTAHRFEAGAPYEDDPRNPGSETSFDKGHGLVDVLAALDRVLGARTSTTSGSTGEGSGSAVLVRTRGRSS